jgi:cell division protein ZapA
LQQVDFSYNQQLYGQVLQKLTQIAERIERLLVRYEELQRTNTLLTEQVAALTQERDSLKSRLSAARARVDALLERLPEVPQKPTIRVTKQLEVQIMGQSYLLGCPEGGESRLLEAVEKVDTAMCKIRDAGKVRARDRIAVLAALNVAFERGRAPRKTVRSFQARAQPTRQPTARRAPWKVTTAPAARWCQRLIATEFAFSATACCREDAICMRALC